MGDFSKKASCAGLVVAAMTGNPVALKALIAQGADIHTCGTLLMQNEDRAMLSDQQVYYAHTERGRKEFFMPKSATYGMNLFNYAILGAAMDWKKKDLTPRMKTIANLLPLGVNTRSGVFNSWTPLHTASHICQPELILLLLSLGADPMETTDRGKIGPDLVPEWCPEGLEAYRFYYTHASEKPKKKQ